MNNQELQNIELDISEIKNILDNHATRESTKRLLRNELIKLENVKKSLSSHGPVSVTTITRPADVDLIPVKNFAWDQSDKFVKVYLSLDDLKLPFDDETIKLTFPDEKSLKVVFGRYKFTLTKLQDNVNTAESYFKRTKSKIVLYLAKAKEGNNWSNIQFSKATNTVLDEKDGKDDPDADADPSSTLMSLMKKMYQEGDDEMKRTIAKSWYESQHKKQTEIDLP